MAKWKELRQQTGLRRFAFSEMAGVSYSTLRRLEDGESGVKPEMRFRILNTLNRLLGQELKLEDVETEGTQA